MHHIPRRITGTTLIELMIAMTIGLFILGATATVYLNSRQVQRTNEQMARLQENARLVLHWIAEDLQMAGGVGNNSNPSMIDGRAGTASQLGSIGAPSGGVADCDDRWYIDTAEIIEIGNDALLPYSGTCLSSVNSNYVDGTDVIAIKRASGADIPVADAENAGGPHANWLLVRTDPLRGEFFIGGTAAPGSFEPAPESTIRRWLAHIYAIRRNPDPNAGGLPELNRINLGSGPGFRRRVLAEGVQDLQIQYGVDRTNDGSPDLYLEPGTENAGDRIVAARVWVLVRSLEPERDYDDSVNTYTYASKTYTPGDGSSIDDATDATRYRRVLLSTTVDLRNEWR